MTQEAVERRKNGDTEGQIYLKAVPLRGVEDIEKIKEDVSKNTIVIVRVTPLAERNVEELRKAVEELYRHVEKKGGDIARLGEERIVVTPPAVKIWRGLY